MVALVSSMTSSSKRRARAARKAVASVILKCVEDKSDALTCIAPQPQTHVQIDLSSKLHTRLCKIESTLEMLLQQVIYQSYWCDISSEYGGCYFNTCAKQDCDTYEDARHVRFHAAPDIIEFDPKAAEPSMDDDAVICASPPLVKTFSEASNKIGGVAYETSRFFDWDALDLGDLSEELRLVEEHLSVRLVYIQNDMEKYGSAVCQVRATATKTETFGDDINSSIGDCSSCISIICGNISDTIAILEDSIDDIGQYLCAKDVYANCDGARELIEQFCGKWATRCQNLRSEMGRIGS